MISTLHWYAVVFLYFFFLRYKHLLCVCFALSNSQSPDLLPRIFFLIYPRLFNTQHAEILLSLKCLH